MTAIKTACARCGVDDLRCETGLHRDQDGRSYCEDCIASDETLRRLGPCDRCGLLTPPEDLVDVYGRPAWWPAGDSVYSVGSFCAGCSPEEVV